jgi:hypothetical protein
VTHARPPVVSQYVWVLRFLGLAYGLGAAIAFFFPAEAFYLLNFGPRILRGVQAIPEPTESFWRMFAAGWGTLCALQCFMASANPRSRGIVLSQVLAKIVIATGFALQIVAGGNYFAYYVGMMIEIPVILMLLYLMAASGRALGAGAARLTTETETPAPTPSQSMHTH